MTLASTRFAELNRLFGEAVSRTKDAAELDRLARVYWFTIEFGVLREDGRIKAYGTGLLSSAGDRSATITERSQAAFRSKPHSLYFEMAVRASPGCCLCGVTRSSRF